MYSYIPLSEPPGLWGAYAEYMYLAPGSIVHKVDPTLPAELAVLFNPLGAGFLWAVEIPETQPGDTVVVLGPGQRGLTSVLACREVGAGTIIVTGLEADVVVEVFSYATAPIAAALDYVRSGGTIVLAGIKGFKPVPDFVSDRRRIQSCWARHATL